jgi:hypothetical protein
MKVIGVLPVGWAPLTPSDLKDGHKMKQNEQFGCFGGKNLRVKSFIGVKLGWEQFEQKHIYTLYTFAKLRFAANFVPFLEGPTVRRQCERSV